MRVLLARAYASFGNHICRITTEKICTRANRSAVKQANKSAAEASESATEANESASATEVNESATEAKKPVGRGKRKQTAHRIT